MPNYDDLASLIGIMYITIKLVVFVATKLKNIGQIAPSPQIKE